MDDISNKRILVTGGAGFIGSELVRQLADRGGMVRVIDNLVTGHRENLKGIPGNRVELTVADIRDTDIVRASLQSIDIVYHLACLGVRHSIHSPRKNHEVNATAALQLLSAVKGAGIKRYVHVSTSEIYGTAIRVPMGENHPAFPMTVYGASKLAGECYARAFYRTYGTPAVVVRPFNTYGPRCHHESDSGEVIPKFMLRCLAGRELIIFGDGNQTRDFIYVSDTARGIMLAGLADEAVGETINIGSGMELTINKLANEVAAALGQSRPDTVHQSPRPGDTLRLYADVTKARDLLGFSPEVPLRDGLRALKRWYDARGVPADKLLEEEVVKSWEDDGGTNYG